MKVTAGPTQISDLTFTGGTDGKDEAFTSCSPCNTITANGGGALFNRSRDRRPRRRRLRRQRRPGRRRDRQRRHADADRRRVPHQQRGVRRWAVLALRGRSRRPASASATRAGPKAAASILRGGTMTLTNSTVTGNGASNAIGGGIVNQAGTLTLTNVTLDANLRGGLETDQGATHLGAEHDPRSGLLRRRQRRMREGRQDHVSRRGSPRRRSPRTSATTSSRTRPAGPPSAPARPAARPGRRQRRPTPTAALLHGSPAIDAGNDSACPPTDQRGVTRRAGRALRHRRLRGGHARAARPSHRRRDRDRRLQRDALGDGRPRRRGRRAALPLGNLADSADRDVAD